MLNIVEGGKIADEGQMCAPPFFADVEDEDWIVMGPISAIAFLIGTIFGAIHLIGWNFFFHFHTERIVWRVASIMTTVIPAIGFIGVIVDVTRVKDDTFLSKLSEFILILSAMPIPLYFPMRFILLVEALISLRDLPQGALEVVEWTLFIPHI